MTPYRKSPHHFIEAYMRDIIIGITAGLIVAYFLGSFSLSLGLFVIIFGIISIIYYRQYYKHPPHR